MPLLCTFITVRLFLFDLFKIVMREDFFGRIELGVGSQAALYSSCQIN